MYTKSVTLILHLYLFEYQLKINSYRSLRDLKGAFDLYLPLKRTDWSFFLFSNLPLLTLNVHESKVIKCSFCR